MTPVRVPEPATLSQVAPAPTLAGVLRRVGWRGVVDAVVPVGLFLVLDTTAGIVWAIGAATAWAVGVAGWRLATRQRTGVLVWVGLGYVLVRGAAGMLTQSKVVFFGPGVAQTALIGLVFIGSVVVRRPAVGYIAPVVYPFEDYVRAHPAYRRVFARLTLIWSVYLLAHVALDIWLLKSVSASQFVLARSAISWPVLIGLFVFSLRYPRRAFRREPDLVPYVDAAEAPRTLVAPQPR